MAGRGPQTFRKRQKEQQRKEKQQEKLARRLQRKQEPRTEGEEFDPELLLSEIAEPDDTEPSSGPTEPLTKQLDKQLL